MFVVGKVEPGGCQVPGSHWTLFDFLRGNRFIDKLIRDNTGGVWLPVVEPRSGAAFTHLKLLSVCLGMRWVGWGGGGGLLASAFALNNPHSGFYMLYLRPDALYCIQWRVHSSLDEYFSCVSQVSCLIDH